MVARFVDIGGIVLTPYLFQNRIEYLYFPKSGPQGGIYI